MCNFFSPKCFSFKFNTRPCIYLQIITSPPPTHILHVKKRVIWNIFLLSFVYCHLQSFFCHGFCSGVIIWRIRGEVRIKIYLETFLETFLTNHLFSFVCIFRWTKARTSDEHQNHILLIFHPNNLRNLIHDGFFFRWSNRENCVSF